MLCYLYCDTVLLFRCTAVHESQLLTICVWEFLVENALVCWELTVRERKKKGPDFPFIWVKSLTSLLFHHPWCFDVIERFPVSKVVPQLLWFCIATVCDWLKISRHFLDQSEVKPKPIVTYSHAFSRAWRQLHVFASSSDWFIGLFTTVVIGQGNYFGFGFTTLSWKVLYIECFLRISKHQEVVWKNDARPSYFNRLQGVWKPDETLFRVFDIASQTDH